MIASLIVLAISFASATAGLFANCKTQRAGVLAAPIFTPTYTLKSFTLAANGQVAYKGNGDNPLVVEYQVCTSLNEPGVPEDGVYYGRLFVPSQHKCIAISNQSGDIEPYFTSLASCNTGYAQKFALFTGARDDIL